SEGLTFMSMPDSSNTLTTGRETGGDVYVFPASFAQERLWFLNRLDPESTLYNLFVAYLVEGELDRDALEASFNEIVRRHEVLRTTFVMSEGRPVRVVATGLTIPIPVVDLRGVPEPQRRAEAERLAVEETLRPFNLEQGPLLRARLFRMGDQSHALVVSFHHIVLDAWSIHIFFPH